MGEKRPTFTKLYAPDGTLVEVEGEERATLLKEQRGYTTSKPRNPTKPATKSGDSDEVAALREQLAKAERERDEALSAATTPAAEEPKK